MFIMNQFMFIYAFIVNVLIEFVANLILCDVYSMVNIFESCEFEISTVS